MNPPRTRSEIIELLIHPGIIAVIRSNKPDQVLPICEALVRGGVIALEITMTTPQALSLIEKAARHFGTAALVGVGSVIHREVCQAALQAGAEFVVSPIARREIAEAAHAADRPVMLGAYTPTEAQLAHEAGSDFIKIFPAENLGAAYIKALRAPLPHLKIVPTGGVDLHNVKDFLNAGCAALGAGSSLVSSALLQTEDWAGLTRRAEKFVEAIREARQG